MIIAGSSSEDGWSWDKAADGFMWGSIAGAVIGGTWGGTHYVLKNAGKMAIKTNINNFVALYEYTPNSVKFFLVL